MDSEIQQLLKGLVGAIVYGAIGLVVFAVALKLVVRLTPFSVKKEIEEDQNVALAIVMGSIFLGLALILAAAVRG